MNKAAEYGHALYELAAEDGIEKVIEKEFGEIAKLFESNEDFINLLTNPRVASSERIGVIDQVFGNKIQPYLLSLIKILTEIRQVALIPLCFKEYQNKYYQKNNIMLVNAISAVELNDSQRQRIISKLEKSMNKSIILENIVDQTCIGGIRLEYNGHMIDASIKNRLVKLQYEIKNADYSQAEV
ncbi:MAG: synthase subcomplex delta subunit [Herbinix sp.]|jgi:F-type H+-transporting ATPase subunit delta|nr:synthase subcomplex delta subunit [Herbinix sp.]